MENATIGSEEVKLLIIGFDGMDYAMTAETIPDKFKKWLKPLTVEVAMTGPSWASFYTGKSVEQHGIFNGWGLPKQGSLTFDDIEKDTFWNILEDGGFSVYVDNLPITDGGFPKNNDVYKDLVNTVIDYKSPGRWRKEILKKGVSRVLNEASSGCDELIEYIKPANLIFVQFSFLDRIGHTYTFKSENTIKKSYKLAIDIINKLLEKFKPWKFLIVSDHGFKRKEAKHNHIGVCITNLSYRPKIVEQTDLFNVILEYFNDRYL